MNLPYRQRGAMVAADSTGPAWQQLGITGWRWAGENLQMNNYADPFTIAMNRLMNSPTHRANILDPEYTHMGAAAQLHARGTFAMACIYTSGGDV